MRGSWVGVCVGILLAGASPCATAFAAPDVPAAIPEASRLLHESEEPGHVDRAIGLLQGVPQGRDSEEVQTLLAEAYYDRGYDMKDRDQAVRTLETAIAHGDRALALAPTNVPARYWRAVAMLAKADKLHGVESFGLVRAAARELDAVVAAEPNLDSAGADRALGKIYLDSPWWFMGDTEKAVQHLEAARRRAPDLLMNRRFLAEAYAADGREADALRELDSILSAPPRPDHMASDRKEQDLARRQAEKLRARLKKP